MSASEEGPGAFVAALCARVFSLLRTRSRDRRLRLCETLPLGEKRFVAVIEYDREKFLLAGTAQSISLLRCLDRPANASGEEVVTEASEE